MIQLRLDKGRARGKPRIRKLKLKAKNHFEQSVPHRFRLQIQSDLMGYEAKPDWAFNLPYEYKSPWGRLW